ncbi:unnamed protein product [Anisakis simplex]|uniref:Signal transducer and activator of transcription 1 (inferred by orthology to a C. elegans protein) n=1 Tax=Anisakis simplex TaxID=6269 RepID=A0A0M3KGR1_ANISI|nr:unnamed protein product [Anisakis simplex]
MLGYADIRSALCELTKECHVLWEENKDMQGRFVNDLAELQSIQLAITQFEHDHRFRNKTFRSDRLAQARASMCEMQRKASQLYETLSERRCSLAQKLNDGVHNVALLQNQLISDRLFDWKNRQKLAQVGVPFENKDQLLDEIQFE